MVSFYDPAFTSLKGLHYGWLIGNQTFQNGWGFRRGHRLVGISSADVKAAKSRLHDNIASSGSKCSGTKWTAVIQSIVSQHKTRLLDSAKAFGDRPANAAITRVHELSHAILYPYLEYPFVNSHNVTEVREITVSRCSSVYTSQLDASELGPSELLIYHSVNIVLGKLCSLEGDLLSWTEKYTAQLLDGEQDLDSLPLSKEMAKRRDSVNSLLEWVVDITGRSARPNASQISSALSGHGPLCTPLDSRKAGSTPGTAPGHPKKTSSSSGGRNASIGKTLIEVAVGAASLITSFLTSRHILRPEGAMPVDRTLRPFPAIFKNGIAT
ncbi:hypothetical protein F5Y19DRAFT_164139 [Xylariaceae sp. FL1651]|nr:hypothetical protein F5Y19DRAFT_164139 [Xylariaceae sp. FL1651]